MTINANDAKITKLLETIEIKKQELGVRPRVSYKTNGVFKFENANDWFNINTVLDPQKFVEALSYILSRQKFHDAAADILGLHPKPLTWNGYTVDEWAEDFKTRLAVVGWEARKKELTEAEQKLKKLVSEDTRTAMEIADLAALIG